MPMPTLPPPVIRIRSTLFVTNLCAQLVDIKYTKSTEVFVLLLTESIKLADKLAS